MWCESKCLFAKSYARLPREKGAILKSILTSIFTFFRVLMQIPLQRLSITHAVNGDAQVTPIVRVLSACPSITDIALNYVELTDEGACHLLDYLAGYPSCLSLELFGNRIGLASGFRCSLCSLVRLLFTL